MATPKTFISTVFYSAYIDIAKGIATVHLKEKDLRKLSLALKLSDEEFFIKQNEKIQNKRAYAKLKKQNTTLNYLLVTGEQKQILKDNYIDFAFVEKEDKFKISFAPSSKERIIKLLYPERAKKKIDTPPPPETSYQRNGRINAELKEIAKQTGDKLEYRIVSSTQLHNLEKSKIKFAYFRKEDEKNNIVFLSCDKQKVENILSADSESKNNEHITNNITRR